MTRVRCSGVHTILGIIIVITIGIFTTYHLSIHDGILTTRSGRGDPNPIAGLEVTLRQISSSPVIITTTVTNKNKYPVTVLQYNSPLDPLAPKLGLLFITPAGASEPLDLPTIQIRRAWPPRHHHLIHLEPGARKSANTALDEEVVDRLGKKASVLLKGSWDVVWSKPKDIITDEVLEQIHRSADVFGGDFASNHLRILVARQDRSSD